MDLTAKNLSEYLSLLARTPEVVSDDLLSLIADELVSACGGLALE